MPLVRPAGPYPIEGVSLETWVVRFDKEGVCTSPQTRAALLNALAAKPNSPVLFFSHGWNNDFADAVSLYKNFLTSFQQIVGKYPLAGAQPVFVGIAWPSIWLPSDDGPRLAAAPANPAEFSAADGAIREIAGMLPEAKARHRFYELMEAKQISQDEARELAGILKPILRPSNDGAPEDVGSEAKIVNSFNDLQAAQQRAETDEDLDKIGTVAGAGGGAGPAAAGLFTYLDPRWPLRLASLYIMKDRAGAVGSSGVAALLRDMLQGSKGPIHLIGHSFGGKIMMSAIAAQAVEEKHAQSLLLLEPAVSHLCFADNVPGREGPGGYRMVLDRVVKPILSTYSGNDFPLHVIYHRALIRPGDLGEARIAAAATAAGNPPNDYAALGGYGPRRAERLVGKIPAPGEPIDTAGTRIVGLDGTIDQRIDSHGGVANQYTAWALRTQMN
jgi:hypothetical protein